LDDVARTEIAKRLRILLDRLAIQFLLEQLVPVLFSDLFDDFGGDARLLGHFSGNLVLLLPHERVNLLVVLHGVQTHEFAFYLSLASILSDVKDADVVFVAAVNQLNVDYAPLRWRVPVDAEVVLEVEDEERGGGVLLPHLDNVLLEHFQKRDLSVALHADVLLTGIILTVEACLDAVAEEVQLAAALNFRDKSDG